MQTLFEYIRRMDKELYQEIKRLLADGTPFLDVVQAAREWYINRYGPDDLPSFYFAVKAIIYQK